MVKRWKGSVFPFSRQVFGHKHRERRGTTGCGVFTALVVLKFKLADGR